MGFVGQQMPMRHWNPKFNVMSRYNLEDYLWKLEHDPNVNKCNTAIISITDPHSPDAGDDYTAPYLDFLRLKFNDCEIDTQYETSMSASQGEQVAKFVHDNEDWADLIIVQCEAGVSRSAGVCAAIMKYVTGDDMQIFGSPRYSPNMNCYRMTLNALMETECSEDELMEKMKLNDSVYFSGDNWDDFGGKIWHD